MIDVTLKGRTGTAAAPFYALSIERVTFLGDNVPVDGETVAILSPDGDTLALGYADGGAVELNINTAEADGATAYLEPTETIRAALVVGDTDNVRAIVGIDLGRNVLDELAPPPELAPKYPTSEALLSILAQMTAQAQRAEDAVEATEKAQKAVAEYVDNTFPAKVTEAEKTLANATDEAVRKIGNEAQDATSTISRQATAITYSLSEAQTVILGNIDTKSQAVNSALDTKVTEANTAFDNKVTSATTALDGKVTEANDAKTDAVKAKGQAETAKGDAEKSAKSAGESADSASKSAKQAENAKAAIGDVGGRLEGVETRVAQKAVKFTNYIKSLYDYQLRQINVSEMSYNTPCHDGWVFKLQYDTSKEYHLSSTGKLTSIPRFSPRTYGNFFNLCLMDLENNVTKIFATNGSVKTLTTISGVGDDVSISQSVVEAFPNAEIDGFRNIVGFASGNGFYVCAGGHILDAELTKVGSFNCGGTFWDSYFNFAYGLRLLKRADKTFKYFDTSTLKQSTIVINDDGTPTITACPYTQDSKAQYLITANQYAYFKVLNGNVTRINENGANYNSPNLPTFKLCGATRTGFVCNGKDLFYVIPASNGSLNSAVQMTFGLVNSYENRNVFAQCVEDGKGNVAVLETVNTIYEENTQYVHIFKKKEA